MEALKGVVAKSVSGSGSSASPMVLICCACRYNCAAVVVPSVPFADLLTCAVPHPKHPAA
jgi:hypothetical protein